LNEKLKRLLNRLSESIKPSIKGAVFPVNGRSVVERRRVSFAEINAAYEADPYLGSVVDSLAAQTVGMGFYTSMNEEYEETTRDGRTAKDVVDEACEMVNLDEKLQVCAREVIRCGNSFWLKIVPEKIEDLYIIPLTAVESIIREKIEPFGFEYKPVGYKLSRIRYGGKTIKADYVIHFRWNPVDNGAFGDGLIDRLLKTLRYNGETRPSFLEMKARIERVLPDIFEKFVGIDQLIIVPGAKPETISAWQNKIKSRPKEGMRLIWSEPGADIKTVAVDPRLRFQEILNYVMDQIVLAGQTPLAKLITTPGFTEASARAAMDMGELIVNAIQRFIKRKIEKEFFKPVIRQAGLDPVQAGVRLNFGTPVKPEIVMTDLLKAAEIGLIRKEEFRKNAVKFGWELWEKGDT